MTTQITVKKLPSVLAFQRTHVVSDAEMFSELDNGSFLKIPVVRHGIRGTQNVNDGKGNSSVVKAATNSQRDVSNIQMTETAKLDPNAKALIVKFGLSMLDLDMALHSCAGSDAVERKAMRDSVNNFITKAKESKGLEEIALRYTRNIANARWLWRNKTVAAEIKVAVYSQQTGKLIATFDALSIPANQFDAFTKEERVVAKELVSQMRGESLDGLNIVARVVMRNGGNVEVYPSQNFVQSKPDGFSRPLYRLGKPPSNSSSIDEQIMGYAAIRDQKIFNAIRTIDTWYESYADTLLPIAVEPLGANLSQQEFYRTGKQSSFEMFKRLNQIDPNSDEGMFCIAALDRGGVYGESDKKAAA